MRKNWPGGASAFRKQKVADALYKQARQARQDAQDAAYPNAAGGFTRVNLFSCLHKAIPATNLFGITFASLWAE